MIYDLEDRTKKFSKNILNFPKEIKQTSLNKNVIEQLIRSATSIGANYCEANGAISKKDFRNKIHICKKEAKETLYWIELLSELLQKQEKGTLKETRKESKELTLIFNKISTSLNN